jgi:hypothetical protein
MARNLKQHIKKISAHNNPDTNKTKFGAVGDKLSADTDPAIAALGADVTLAGTTLNTLIIEKESAHEASIVATKAMNDSNAYGCQIYNNAADEVEKTYPDNVSKWLSFGYDVTKDIASDQDVPEKVENCVMMQGDYEKTCKIEFDHSLRATNYTVQITKENPTESQTYIIVSSPKIVYTTSSITFDVPDDYLNVPIWAKVTAHNSAGDAPASTPFGGLRIQ